MTQNTPKTSKYAEALTWWQTGHLNEYTPKHKQTIEHALKLADALEREPSEGMYQSGKKEMFEREIFKAMITQLKKEISDE